jgi:oligopeptide transport system substrate-binding protein
MRIRILLLLVSASTILLSCGGNNSETADMKAVGGKIYGGQFSFMSGEKIESLFPLSVSDVFSNRIMSQIFEPLLKIDIATMKVEPSLAESFTVSKDATVFTLKIRKGVFFHDDECFGGKGRELKVEDVKYSLDMACAGMEENEISYLLVDKIKGAKEFNKKNKTLDIAKEGVSGIKIINSNTIQIKLKQPFVGFDKILSHNSLGIYPKEAVEKYGKEINIHPVGTGAFSLETFNDEQIVLKRNPNYWGKDEFGNKLPFLDKVNMTYTKNKKSELLAFRKQKIDVVLEIPVEDIQDIFGSLEDAQSGKNVKHRVETEISLKMAYISFANESKEFKDERVRKAFNLAIDRQGIIENSLEGEGYAALNGFVPSINTYPSDKVKGYVFNPTLAKQLLAQAGFPDGSKFPSLEIYVNTKEGSGVHKMVKGVVADLKKNLNVNLKIKLCSIQERNEAIHSGKAKLWRAGWIADYPDPENFLCLFYGGNISDNDGSVVNDFKFSNKEFDQLYQKGLRELDKDKRNELMVKCDQLVIDHAAIMPILTDDFIVMVNVRVKDLKTNPLQSLDFSKIYIKKPR